MNSLDIMPFTCNLAQIYQTNKLINQLTFVYLLLFTIYHSVYKVNNAAEASDGPFTVKLEAPALPTRIAAMHRPIAILISVFQLCSEYQATICGQFSQG